MARTEPRETYGGDPACHLPLATLEARYAELGTGPRDRGSVKLLVVRPTKGERVMPAQVELTVDGGMAGDRWISREPRHPDSQITLMRHDLGELIANGQSLGLFGDNLLVDLDLTEDNLPTGSRLRIGGCLVEVTPEPHNGCAQYAGRFGHDALRFISQKPLRPARLRGIYVRVLESGTVAVGDSIEVIERGIDR